MSKKLRIACIQLSPEHGNVQKSIEEADKLISDINPNEIDLLVLPEMALTGYIFDAESIKPFLEEDGKGPCHDWARQTANRLNTHVALGYPEKCGNDCYNSLMFIDPDGNILHNYRKTHLYPFVDNAWAKPGTFSNFELYFPSLDRKLKIVPGICMDLNPWNFEAEWDAFEFANYIVKHDPDLIVLSMAWNTRFGSKEEIVPADRVRQVNYWINRLAPLCKSSTCSIVLCNRVGMEHGEDCISRYDGSSTMIKFSGQDLFNEGALDEIVIADANKPLVLSHELEIR